MKKILFIANNNPIDPLGIMYLISNTNAEMDILFMPGNKINDNIKKYDIIGFSTITGSHLYHNELAKQIKKINPNVITIMGGPHPTFFPKKALRLEYIDFICRGEGITAFNKWVNGINTNNIISKESFISNKLDPLVDLDKVNPPNRTILYKDKKRANNPIKDFIEILGCNFNCSYCFNHSYRELYKGQPAIRFKNPAEYVEEILECKSRYGMKLISFQEDTFVIKQDWFYEMTDLLAKKVNVPWHCNVRCDLVDGKIIKHMKDTGCSCVTFAIENGDETYRKEYLNRRMTDAQILSASKLFHKYNINIRTQNILGLPMQDLSGDIKTLELNSKCKPTMSWAALFQPFPNTKLAQTAVKAGEWNGNIDNIDPGYFNKSTLKLKDKKKRERLQKLFCLATEYPFIRKYVQLLIKLPLGFIYEKLHSKFKNKKYNEFYKA